METAEQQQGVSTARIPLVTEIMSYLGGAIAVAGIIALLGTFWDKLGVVGQLGLTGAAAAMCLTGGVLLGRIDDRAGRRLQQFLLFIGVFAFGAMAGIAVWHIAKPIVVVPDLNPGNRVGASEWGLCGGAFAAVLCGSVVYWRYRTVLQQLAVGIAAFVLVPQAIQVVYGRFDAPGWWFAIAFAVLGIVWGLLGLRGMLPPRENTALAISGALVCAGLLTIAVYTPVDTVMGVDAPQWPLWVALAGSVLLLLVGIALKKIVTVGFGAAAVTVTLPMLLSNVFRASIVVPVVILMLGVALMAIAAFIAVRHSRSADAPPPERPVETAAENAGPPAEPAARPERRIPIVSEVLGYAGGAFALGAGLALILVFANDIGVFGQLAVCAIAAVAGIVGGFAIGRIDDSSARRLEAFLLAVGVAGTGATVGLAAYRLVQEGPWASMYGLFAISTAGDWGWFMGSLAAAIAGGLVWWRRRTWMQQLAFGIPVAMACVTVLAIPQTTGPDWVVGAVLVALGVVWGTLGLLGRLEPTDAALTLASLGIVSGFLAMAQSGPGAPYTWALWAGLGACAALIAGGLVAKRYVMVGIGAVGLWSFLPSLVNIVFPNSIAGPVVIVVAGVLLVGAGIVFAFRAQRKRRGGAPAAG